jgi:hypothetical protein
MIQNDLKQTEFSPSLLTLTGRQIQFCRENLPKPEDYYRSQGIALIGGGMWRTALCPFHRDRNPSLRINLVHGGFCCMACGAKGGDVLDFHRKRYEMAFTEAIQALGAWRMRK